MQRRETEKEKAEKEKAAQKEKELSVQWEREMAQYKQREQEREQEREREREKERAAILDEKEGKDKEKENETDKGKGGNNWVLADADDPRQILNIVKQANRHLALRLGVDSSDDTPSFQAIQTAIGKVLLSLILNLPCSNISAFRTAARRTILPHGIPTSAVEAERARP